LEVVVVHPYLVEEEVEGALPYLALEEEEVHPYPEEEVVVVANPYLALEEEEKGALLVQ
jgi:hypothetical protein